VTRQAPLRSTRAKAQWSRFAAGSTAYLSFLASPARITAIAFVILAGLVGARWITGNYDWTYFAVAGDQFTDPRKTPIRVHVAEGPGYDGQFFLRLAFEPFSAKRTAWGIEIDGPAWRQQRIVYPLIVHIAALGQPRWVPFTLIAVNLVGVTVLVLACSVLAGRVGLAPAWGILPAFFPGLTMGLARDLAEPLNGCLLTLAVFACTSASFGWAALALAAAALTRETTMISVAAVAATVAGLALRRSAPSLVWSRVVLIWLAPAVALLAWHSALRVLWSGWPAAIGVHSGFITTYPLEGLIEAYSQVWRHRPLLHNLATGLYLAWIVSLAVEVVRSLGSLPAGASPARRLSLAWCRTAWLAWTAFALFLSRATWEANPGLVRHMTEWAIMGFLALLLAARPPSMQFVGLTAAVFLGTVTRLLTGP
jgi:hypothetical protein